MLHVGQWVPLSIVQLGSAMFLVEFSRWILFWGCNYYEEICNYSVGLVSSIIGYCWIVRLLSRRFIANVKLGHGPSGVQLLHFYCCLCLWKCLGLCTCYSTSSLTACDLCCVLLYYKYDFFVDFYEIKSKRRVTIRNNSELLLECIQPNNEFIGSMLSMDCITDEQCRFVQLQLPKRKNARMKAKSHFVQETNSERNITAKLLHLARSVDQIKSLNFVRSLRRTNQNIVARIIENGGG